MAGGFSRNGIADTPEEWKRVGWVAPGDNHPSAFAHPIYVEGLVEAMQSMHLAPGGKFSSPPYPALP